MSGEPPLDGVTVVSLEQAVAAPFATRTLADLGARVIKVERVDGGDFARGYDSAVRGIASHFVYGMSAYGTHHHETRPVADGSNR